MDPRYCRQERIARIRTARRFVMLQSMYERPRVQYLLQLLWEVIHRSLDEMVSC
jgi:hypothetical protein